jgi:hypothetical protein
VYRVHVVPALPFVPLIISSAAAQSAGGTVFFNKMDYFEIKKGNFPSRVLFLN